MLFFVLLFVFLQNRTETLFFKLLETDMVEILTLKVQRVDELSKIYIVEYEEKLIRVHMVQEQVGKGNPGEIVCRIEKSENYCYITQDMQTLLRRHYKEGDEVMYRIEKTTPTFYLLKDDLGYQTYLDKK